MSAIGYRDHTSALLDKTNILKMASNEAYSWSVNPKHLSQEFVCRRNLVAADVVAHHQDYTTTASFYGMDGIANANLKYLREQKLNIAICELSHCDASFHVFKYLLGAHAGCCSGCLNDTSPLRNPVSESFDEP
jgi:hypothetical protein